MYYLVCPVGAIGGREDLLTYSFSGELTIGQIVRVPFGRQTKLGVIWQKTKIPEFKVKDISGVEEEQLLPELMDLASWISEYYAARLSIVLQTMLPAGIGKKRRQDFQPGQLLSRKDDHKPNADQANAIKRILSSSQTTHLLHGVTGSGKTLIYRELAKKMLSSSKSSLVLVPEISLTPQLASHFSALTNNIVIMHSQLTEAERHQIYRKIANSKEPWIIIGPRSALFAPLKNIGLIVIDECHEPSYVQDSQPKYSALRVGRKLADIHAAKLILASATPNITDYYFAKQTKTSILELKKPTTQYNRTVSIIDATESSNFTTSRIISNHLIDSIKNSLADGEQTLLFHNRRATARLALCSNCGWSAECKNCHIPMRLHHDEHILKCHVCGLTEKLPASCPECKQPDIEFKGLGTKRIEQEVQKLFPDSVIARFDSDTIKKDQLHNRYKDLVDGEIDIIIGTQGITKGLDLANLTTIGVVSSDTEMYVPDFSSSERTFQLISQVLGRAGRSGKKSRVIIQSLNSKNPTLLAAKDQNYLQFYNEEIENRRLGHLPPFTFLLQLQTGYKREQTAVNNCQNLRQKLKQKYPKITVHQPTPAFHSYKSGKHYMQLVITSQKRSTLVEIVKNLPANWQFTLDPINLM
jgi:primosomal protein N' (replication factor Y)